MIQEDNNDQFKLMRDIAEHNAMFQNPEGVRQMRESRERMIVIPDDDFKDTIKEVFGRKISFNADEIDETDNEVSGNNLYDDLDFDDVKFTPFGE